MVGDLDSPSTYEKARAENAQMVVTTRNDMINTNVAFTVREFTQQVPIHRHCQFARLGRYSGTGWL
jgi:voltage-gated potassium channel